MKPLKIMFLAPHLSTGGMPAFLLKRIEALKENTNCEICVVEYQCYSMDFVTHRDQIQKLVMFHTLYENKMELFDMIDSWKPDIIHIDEMSERLNPEVIEKLYDENRQYRIVETCHDISFKPEDKIYIPDAYAFCTSYHLQTFKINEGYKAVIEFPIDRAYADVNSRRIAKHFACSILDLDPDKKHVVNIGIWAPWKNQAEGLEIARKYPEFMFHFVGNQAENFKNYWEPLMVNLPPNVIIWGESNKTDTFLAAADIFMFNSTWECNPLVLKEAISYGLPIAARNLPQYMGKYKDYVSGETSTGTFKLEMPIYNIPTNNTTKDFGINHFTLYKKIMNNKIPAFKQNQPSYRITHHYVNGPCVQIEGHSSADFRVEFWDKENLVYADTIKTGHWTKANREYYTDWSIRVYKNEKLVDSIEFSLNNKRVFIAFDSSSLGDTIAWIPYVEEFRKKHNCKAIVSTFKNFLFEDVYPELEFVSPGTTVENIYAMYKIGWFYDSNKEPVLPNTIPLQATACNILGLEYKEIKPKILSSELQKTKSPYITIATNSTAGCKFWTRENWQEVINYLYNKGYQVYNMSLEDNPFENCSVLDSKNLDITISCIKESEFFIGLSSGLSWLAWGLDKEVIMIANFTNAEHEFKCHRPVDTTVCNSCWNNKNFRFDKGDWNWCPIHKGTDRQFECQKAISPEMVIDKIKTILQP